MTILAAQDIREYCTDYTERMKHRPWEYTFPNMISPFVERDVIRGRSFGLSSAGYDIRVSKFLDTDGNPLDSVRMNPGDFILASSVERIKMPKDLICIVHDKSSWAREGLAIQNTVLEPGWEGFITLELSFHRPKHSVKILSGDPIAQLIFHKLSAETSQPYVGKYQNQEDMPIEARLEKTKTEVEVEVGDPLGR